MKNTIIQAAIRLSLDTDLPLENEAPTEAPVVQSAEFGEGIPPEEEQRKNTKESTQSAQIPSKSKSHAAMLQLFRILARLLQGTTPQREQDDSQTDRKLRRRTQEKEQAHGMKHSGGSI